MLQVQQDSYWTLFSLESMPDLSNMYGKIFKNAYEAHELSGRGIIMSAKGFWCEILTSQIATEFSLIFYMDAINGKCSQWMPEWWVSIPLVQTKVPKGIMVSSRVQTCLARLSCMPPRMRLPCVTWAPSISQLSFSRHHGCLIFSIWVWLLLYIPGIQSRQGEWNVTPSCSPSWIIYKCTSWC